MHWPAFYTFPTCINCLQNGTNCNIWYVLHANTILALCTYVYVYVFMCVYDVCMCMYEYISLHIHSFCRPIRPQHGSLVRGL